MKKANRHVFIITLLLASGLTQQAVAATPDIDIWKAVIDGNIEAIQQNLDAGVDIDIREPSGGNTPLMVAALLGQTQAAEFLIAEGADINLRNTGDRATALHIAAFFGHPDTVKLLLSKGIEVNTKNNRGETALDTVVSEWDAGLEGVYRYIAAVLEIQLDLKRIQSTRPQIAALLRQSRGQTKEQMEEASSEITSTGYRGSYFLNGQIHVNTYGTPEGKPLTSGHQDFKPSWSKTGDMLIFFRRLKDDPVVTNWKTQIHIINVDGTGLHALTDGTHTDFNQTWTRDGTNTPIWNRRHPDKVSFYVMASKVGNKPGQEIALTDKSYHTWAYSCLVDGRILVQCAHPEQGWGYFLMTRNPEGEPGFERIECPMAMSGILDRISISPSETKVCFEYQKGFTYKDPGRTLYIANFDAKKPSITNAKPFANEEGVNRWFAYPRWTKDEKAIVYHASPSLYMFNIEDRSTVKVSTKDGADYRYPHCEATPK
jgi:hypothetical protein